MPSGKTHDRITLWILPWTVCGSYILTRNGELTLLFSGGFLFSGLMFGPDLDIYSVQFKRWGILRWLWLPYQKLLHHRSFLSHGFILGTVIRIIYLLLWLFILGSFFVAIAQLIIGFNWNWHTFIVKHFNLIITEYRQEAIAIFTGLELGSMSHYFSDWLGSANKKKQKAQKPKPKVKKTKNSTR
ncbi:Uncharacterized metal-binding protein [Hyella patelloides LEGE 07179]|uniref:Uncharacterized metal-binding protein n=1 Tax=Hyella patelloides LEGE 07179 TaxID=945734 RepID=A0A563W385_9CYAN|nr:metal-binding protein [Hyella patelloides]VEP18169.1 Uncharacterized metal-binding protein [Hyella patelloides LEGE 07179]